jgi:hypothetical protein
VSHFRSLKLHFTAGLAALLLVAQLGAVAHAVKHEADKAHAPCALCVFADHLGKAPISSAPPPIIVEPNTPPPTPPTTAVSVSFAGSYHSRAPPRLLSQPC